ncbi:MULTISPECIES: DUF397 domain-containing protein [unclassified Streptomyces]|uniref:DUF397 domain-containing protein n=1 Tax=unclassified Streptomyces TaxID=2593676 RepID=UPI000C26E565|nr:DUF397 domain-containing protein [Streptomyces sp. CB02959]PJN31674.1 DUF397 domain-containing protein [Streptomyces sp. CB02959]
MSTLKLHGTAWRKSSYSGTGGNCIEVADSTPGVIPVRDSKEPIGCHLAFSTAAWYAFIKALKDNEPPFG